LALSMRGKPSKSGGPSADGERRARAETAPARASLLDILGIDGGRTLSVEEMAIELQSDVVRARYHLRVLALLGLVEVAGEELGHDFYERFYRLAKEVPAPSSGRE
jgi:hypothetical protein